MRRCGSGPRDLQRSAVSEKLRSILHGAERTGSATGTAPRVQAPGVAGARLPRDAPTRARRSALRRKRVQKIRTRRAEPHPGYRWPRSRPGGSAPSLPNLLRKITSAVAALPEEKIRILREAAPSCSGASGSHKSTAGAGNGPMLSSTEGMALPRNASKDVRVSLQAARKLPLKRLAPGPNHSSARNTFCERGARVRNAGFMSPSPAAILPSRERASTRTVRVLSVYWRAPLPGTRLPTPVSSSRP